MAFKVIALFMLLCTMQGINSKGLGPFWGVNPYMVPTIDPQLYPIVSEVQMRLSQAQAVSKSAIGMNVGLASKNIGLATSQAKITVKALINNAQSNPNITKDCLSLNKDNINLVNTQSKNQLSFCSKSSQLLLKSVTQVQKELSFQAATLNQELNMAVNQCKLEHPLPTDTAAVTDCVTLKADEIKEKITVLEQNILDTVQTVDTSVAQIVSDAKLCTQQVQQTVQQQAEAIEGALDECTNTVASVVVV